MEVSISSGTEAGDNSSSALDVDADSIGATIDVGTS